MKKSQLQFQSLNVDSLISTCNPVPIQAVIDKLQSMIDDGYTSVCGESRLMYYEPAEDSDETDVITELVFLK